MAAGSSSQKHIKAGTVLFHEGDNGSTGFLIASGVVEVWIERGQKRVELALLKSGDLFGEMSAIDCQPRSASATAKTDCTVIEFTHRQIFSRISEVDPVIRRLIKTLAERLRITNAKLTKAFGTNNERKVFLPDRSHEQASPFDALALEADLEKAIENEELELFFQPIVDLQDLTLAGFESLVRWNHPDQGLICPDRFISQAEECGLIGDLTRQVVKKTCSAMSEFQLAALRNIANVGQLFLTANISGKNLIEKDFATWVGKIIGKNGCCGDMLKLEITETSLVENLEVAKTTLSALRKMNVGIAVDDFGTGHSNLATLIELPMSTLKIDRSFITSKLSQSQNQKVVKMILGLANELDADVVAEGIETGQDLALLREMNCRYGQGYLFAKPLPQAKALELVKTWNKHTVSSLRVA